MVSFHTQLIPNQRKSITPEFEDSSKKRKLEDEPKEEEFFEKRFKPQSMSKSIFDIELHLETPLPFDWQRCLDIQSGQVYFCNTRTHERTSRDPRRTKSPEPPTSSCHMSLDLELNLPCDHSSLNKSSSQTDDHHNNSTNSNSCNYNSKDLFSSLHNKKINSNGSLESTRPSWLAFEGGEEEMVAAVCKRCFMLVMLCKSSPACPNCKFMHPPPEQQTVPNLFKKRLTQLLY